MTKPAATYRVTWINRDGTRDERIVRGTRYDAVTARTVIQRCGGHHVRITRVD